MGDGAHIAPIYIIMELMQNVADYGDARSFIATGIVRIFFVSPNMIRVTFARADMRADGVIEYRVSGHIDWDVNQLQAAHRLFAEAIAKVIEQGPVTIPGYNAGVGVH
jgi:hypothetical protein